MWVPTDQKVVMMNAFNRVQKALTRAPYETRKLRRDGNCMCLPVRFVGQHGLCAPRNRHEQMFWFGRHGTMFIVFATQAILMLLAL